MRSDHLHLALAVAMASTAACQSYNLTERQRMNYCFTSHPGKCTLWMANPTINKALGDQDASKARTSPQVKIFNYLCREIAGQFQVAPSDTWESLSSPVLFPYTGAASASIGSELFQPPLVLKLDDMAMSKYRGGSYEWKTGKVQLYQNGDCVEGCKNYDTGTLCTCCRWVFDCDQNYMND